VILSELLSEGFGYNLEKKAGDMSRIRIRLKEVAKEKGMTITALTHKTFLAYSTIQAIYRDPYQSITLDTLKKLADALEVSVHDLIEEVPDETTEDSQ
jgi:DNA-binding Xre family transcriptional regulator